MSSVGYSASQDVDGDEPFDTGRFFVGPSSIESQTLLLESDGNVDTIPDQKVNYF